MLLDWATRTSNQTSELFRFILYESFDANKCPYMLCGLSFFRICSHNYSTMYPKSTVREGNIRKGAAPGAENSLMGGCSGH